MIIMKEKGKEKRREKTSRAWSHCFLRTRSDMASAAVLAQALALFLRSSFFLIFLMGVFLDLPSINASEVPGNSPCFHSFFLPTAGEEEEEEEVDFLLAGEANAQRTTPQTEAW